MVVLDHYPSVDWDRDGDTTDLAEDIAPYILTQPSGPGFQTAWGRDQPRAFSPLIVPESECELDNEDGTFSNLFPGSPMYGYIERGADITFDIEYGVDAPFNDLNTPFNDVHTLFSGRTRRRIFTGSTWDVVESGGMGQYTVKLHSYSKNGLLLTAATITTQQVYTAQRTDQIITLVLDEIGWPVDKRKISPGLTTVLYWWANQRSCTNVIAEMVATEGASAIAYIDAEDNFVFHGRDWRNTNPRSLTPQATFSDTIFGTDPGFESTEILFNDPSTLFNGIPDLVLYYVDDPIIRAQPEDVINSCGATVNTRQLTALGPVWTYNGIITLGAGQSIDVWPETSDPFQNAVSPVNGTDFTYTGSLPTFALQALSGQQAKLTITSAAGSVISGLQLRAQLLQTIGQTNLKTTLSPALLADSIHRHGVQHYAYPLWPEIDPNVAQDLVNGQVLRYNRLRPQITISTVVVDEDHANALFYLQVDDRVTIINRRRGIATDVYIERIEHKVVSRNVHMVTFGCEQVYQESIARWDGTTSTFNGVLARWGY